VRTSEAVTLAYLVYAVVVAWVRPIAPRQRGIVTIVAALDAAWILAIASPRSSFPAALRDWLPALQILIGYRLSGPLFTDPMPRVEAWLGRSDRWLFDRAGFGWFAARGPRAMLELLELAYVSAYLMVPLGFALAYWSAGGVDADRYWTPVVAAELVCYAVLPWVRTRTPASLGLDVAIDSRPVTARRMNRTIQRHGSIQVNTIPSGHAAGAFATALVAGAVVPLALVPLLLLATAITVGSVVGRYHYFIDGLLGAAVGVWAAVRFG
jgi:hypothetical protein